MKGRKHQHQGNYQQCTLQTPYNDDTGHISLITRRKKVESSGNNCQKEFRMTNERSIKKER